MDQFDPQMESGTDPVREFATAALIDPVIDAQVTALLAEAPEAAPMPDAVADRVGAALAAESRARAERAGRAELQASDHDDGGVTQLWSRARRNTPGYAAAAVAAAAGVIAVGGTALHANKRPDSAAALGDFHGSRTVKSAVKAPSPGVHIQLSTTAYDPGNVAVKARELLSRPGPEIGPLDAESPTTGPLATPDGLAACLSALGEADPTAVSADLATYDGAPAAVIVVTKGSASTAWVVERSCAPDAAGLIASAIPVP